MPDLVRNSLSVDLDGLGFESKPPVAGASSSSGGAVRSLIGAFENVFNKTKGTGGINQTDRTSEDIPAATFVEFVKVHLSSEWSLAIQHHMRQLAEGSASADARLVDSPVNKIRVSSIQRAADSTSLSRALTIDRTR